MLIYPAIDLIEGACVRLLQGRFEDVTRYGDPAAQLAAFESAGAAWAHIVDLDGAKAGAPRQRELIARLAASTRLNIQSGGGVRERADVEALLAAGVARVVVGSAAAKRPEEVAQWLADLGPEKICCAFDVRAAGDGYEVAVHGWQAGGGVTLNEALRAYRPGLLRHILVTDISRDGALTGPNVPLIAMLARDWPGVEVQASGGVAALDDLGALRQAGAGGVIIGRALYERRFTLEEALAR